MSKTTPNEIISLIDWLIQQTIVGDCHAAEGFFSLSEDEVRDVSNHEQLAVPFRFVDKENIIKEPF